MDLPPRPATCCIGPCTNPPSVPLAYPSRVRDKRLPSFVLWFCHGCSEAYKRMGYEDVEGETQGALL